MHGLDLFQDDKILFVSVCANDTPCTEESTPFCHSVGI